jgi:hypothetical protein
MTVFHRLQTVVEVGFTGPFDRILDRFWIWKRFWEGMATGYNTVKGFIEQRYSLTPEWPIHTKAPSPYNRPTVSLGRLLDRFWIWKRLSEGIRFGYKTGTGCNRVKLLVNPSRVNTCKFPSQDNKAYRPLDWLLDPWASCVFFLSFLFLSVGCTCQLSARPMGLLCLPLHVSWLNISAECQAHRPLVSALTCRFAMYVSWVPGPRSSCVIPCLPVVCIYDSWVPGPWASCVCPCLSVCYVSWLYQLCLSLPQLAIMSAECQAHEPLVFFLACQLAIYISRVPGPWAFCVIPCLSAGHYVSRVPGPWVSCVFPCPTVGCIYQLSARPTYLLCLPLPVGLICMSAECQAHEPLVFFLSCQLAISAKC